MEQGIKNSFIKGVLPEVLGGLDKVETSLDAVHNGVSGRKIVLEPWV